MENLWTFVYFRVEGWGWNLIFTAIRSVGKPANCLGSRAGRRTPQDEANYSRSQPPQHGTPLNFVTATYKTACQGASGSFSALAEFTANPMRWRKVSLCDLAAAEWRGLRWPKSWSKLAPEFNFRRQTSAAKVWMCQQLLQQDHKRSRWPWIGNGAFSSQRWLLCEHNHSLQSL